MVTPTRVVHRSGAGGAATLAAPMEPTPTAEADPTGAAVGPGAAPAVVAVTVCGPDTPRDALEATLAALTRQDYPQLVVLVVDDGSPIDVAPAVAEVLPTAYVLRTPGAGGEAAAANEVLGRIEGATFLWFLRPGARPEPEALRVMVEEAYRSNAAIVGPKLVEVDRPEVLREVGWSIDRFGVPHSGLEPGELDQEQHDAVRDVFFVSDAAMLVRSDLFAALGGFDPAASPGAADLDLCWRARLAGARVLVTPDARVPVSGPTREALGGEVATRQRIRTWLTCTSTWTLLWTVPLALVLAGAEAAVLALSGRRRQAGVLAGAWWWNLAHLGRLRRRRRAVQATRVVHDGDLRFLQVRGSSRLRRFWRTRLRAEERIEELSLRGREWVSDAGARAREPVGVLALGFVAVVLVGSRDLLLSGVAEVGQNRAWPGIGELWRAYGSGWRPVLLGSPAPAPVLQVLLAAWTVPFAGAAGLARTAAVVLALPVGTWGAWRLGRAVAGPGLAALACGLAYGVNPLHRNAIAAGRLGPLVTAALAPWLVLLLCRVGRCHPERPPTARTRLGAAALLAVMVAAWPPSALVPLVLAAAFGCARAFVGGGEPTRPLAVAALVTTGLALLLLLPWPLAYLGAGPQLAPLGVAFAGEPSLSRVVRFATGPAGAGASGWVLAGAGLLVLALAWGPRLVWAVRGWALVVLGWACTWVPARLGWPVPAPEGTLVPAALGLALAVGLGAAAFAEDVRRFHFGWRQVASVGGALALSFPAAAFAVDAWDGAWHTPARGWPEQLGWMAPERSEGGFRVLWLGDPSALPLDPLRSGPLGYGLTESGPGDARVLLPPPDGGARRLLARTVAALRGDRSPRLGRVLGVMAVRYVVVPQRLAPDGPARPVPASLLAALDAQLDLVRLEQGEGLAVYEVETWVPTRASFAGAEVPAPGAGDPLRAALVTEVGPARPWTPGRAVPAGALVEAAAADDRFVARGAPGTVRRSRPAHGWANAWTLERAGRVGVHDARQWRRDAVVAAQVVAWGALAAWGLGLHHRASAVRSRLRRRGSPDG